MMSLENLLKGRMAETLVEELLHRSGNTVYRFGYEAILQNLVQLNKRFDPNNEVGKKIQTTPDFIVIDKKDNPVFVEVIFRRVGELFTDEYKKDDFTKLARLNKFWVGTRLIIVNCRDKPPYFEISYPPYLDKNKKLVLKPLLEETDWNIDNKLYITCEKLVQMYLKKDERSLKYGDKTKTTNTTTGTTTANSGSCNTRGLVCHKYARGR